MKKLKVASLDQDIVNLFKKATDHFVNTHQNARNLHVTSDVFGDWTRVNFKDENDHFDQSLSFKLEKTPEGIRLNLADVMFIFQRAFEIKAS